MPLIQWTIQNLGMGKPNFNVSTLKLKLDGSSNSYIKYSSIGNGSLLISADNLIKFELNYSNIIVFKLTGETNYNYIRNKVVFHNNVSVVDTITPEKTHVIFDIREDMDKLRNVAIVNPINPSYIIEEKNFIPAEDTSKIQIVRNKMKKYRAMPTSKEPRKKVISVYITGRK